MSFFTGKDSCLRMVSRLMLMLTLLSMPSHSLFADAASDRRIRVGLNLFRTFVAADQSLETTADGRVPIAILYLQSERDARQLQQQLQQTLPSVQGRPVVIETLSLQQLKQRMQQQQPPAALFVSERLQDHERELLVRCTVQDGVAVFSPFEGDVEQGILGGLSVEAAVKPTINIATLRRSDVRIKRFYLSVARQYE